MKYGIPGEEVERIERCRRSIERYLFDPMELEWRLKNSSDDDRVVRDALNDLADVRAYYRELERLW